MEEYAIVVNNAEDEGIVAFVNKMDDAFTLIDVVGRASKKAADAKFWVGKIVGVNRNMGTIKEGDVIALDFIDGEDVFGSSHEITFEDSFKKNNAAFCRLSGCKVDTADIISGWFDKDLSFCGIANEKGCAVFRFDGEIPETKTEILTKCEEIVKKNIVAGKTVIVRTKEC